MYLGIEIGGTKLQLGIGPGDGTLRALIRRSVDVAAGGEGIRRQIEETVPLLLQQANLPSRAIRGMAYGFGGPVDDHTRRVLKSHQVAGWDGFPLAAWSESRLGFPCALGNDCDVAALAEASFGASRGHDPVFYVTVGSGIGGGLVLQGRIYRGSGRGAAEIGHLRLRGRHVCPRTGHWIEFGPLEDFASGWAIQRTAAARLRDEPQRSSVLRGLASNQLTVQAIGEAARNGDDLAREVLAEAVRYLAWGVCQVIALLAPKCIVVGGGVSLLGEDLFFAPLRAAVAEHVFRPFANTYVILPAELGEEVVVHGALALARSRFADAGDSPG
ncbi:MAG: ROK family protein [Gemmatales bacterium]|nr:ROK family protein [Gemmatales bacterium]MDW8387472.1 ROK family protein [Gemmatales bacterium]